MVHSVTAVANTDKIKRDANKTIDYNANGKKEQSLFAEIFNQTVEVQQAAPRECRTLTYGQDCRLHPFLYQQRECHY